MKKAISCIVAFLGLTTAPAFAADFPSGPVPAVQSFYNWTGFYVGGNGGYGWSSGTSNSVITGGLLNGATSTGSGNMSGGIAGGQIGFNWQSGSFVFGVEGDYQWSGQKKTKTFGCGIGCTISETSGIDSFGTARARVGAAFDRVLVYATGGAAWTSASDALNASAGGITANLLSASGNKVGWTIGAGLEAALIDNWSAKIEYLYISTSNIGGTGAIPAILGGGTITETAQLKDSIVRFGINYRFPIGGAVVAKY